MPNGSGATAAPAPITGAAGDAPPFGFSVGRYLSGYATALLTVTKIVPQKQGLPSSEAGRLILPERRRLEQQLLGMERQYGGLSFAYVGTCLHCPEGTCTRPDGKPCRHPELVRPSLEACGFDIGKTTAELFGIDLKWGTDGQIARIPNPRLRILPQRRTCDMERIKAVFNWSGGKDSAHALLRAMQSGKYEIVALLTTVNRDTHRSTMHGIPTALLQAQADSIGIPPAHRRPHPERQYGGLRRRHVPCRGAFQGAGRNLLHLRGHLPTRRTQIPREAARTPRHRGRGTALGRILRHGDARLPRLGAQDGHRHHDG